jgi:hypothetical protein
MVRSVIPLGKSWQGGCPLLPGPKFKQGDVAVPNNIDCDEVCREYQQASENEDGIEIGFTCDATLCTAPNHAKLVADACKGLNSIYCLNAMRCFDVFSVKRCEPGRYLETTRFLVNIILLLVCECQVVVLVSKFEKRKTSSHPHHANHLTFDHGATIEIVQLTAIRVPYTPPLISHED